MPKVLVAGEKAFFIHSFSNDELNQLEISRTRNDSTYVIGSTLDDDNMTIEKLESIKPDVMMMLKQSESWRKSRNNLEMDGFSLMVFRGKNQNAKKSYIATWCGQSEAALLSQNPGDLIRSLIQGFNQLFNPKDYHNKSQIHNLMSK